MSKELSKVVIVGRANVGKSTLFNRISSEVKSLTLDYAGVTRDILRDKVEWEGKNFELIDTGGVSFQKTKDVLAAKVYEAAFKIIEEADVIIFLIDGSAGLVGEDKDISAFLRKLGKNVIVTINKSDRAKTEEHKHEAYELGYKNIVLISAEHGLGINDLLEVIINLLPVTSTLKQEKPTYNVLLLGRPNVGKSSLMNALLKHERMIVSEIPGTTREPITESISFYKQHLTLTDTPGIRRKRAVSSKIETLMVKSTFDSLRDTDIVLLLIDASEGRLLDQDLKLAFYAFQERSKALIILINKYDLATEENIKLLEQNFDLYKHLIKKVPVLRISCKTGKNVGHVLPLIDSVWKAYNLKFSQNELYALFLDVLTKRPLMHTGYRLNLYGAKQIKHAPIIISLTVNEPDWFGPSQLGFFENLMRKKYDLTGVPIKFVVQKK